MHGQPVSAVGVVWVVEHEEKEEEGLVGRDFVDEKAEDTRGGKKEGIVVLVEPDKVGWHANDFVADFYVLRIGTDGFHVAVRIAKRVRIGWIDGNDCG